MNIIIKSSLTNKEVKRIKMKTKAEAIRMAKFFNENMKSNLRYCEVG